MTQTLISIFTLLGTASFMIVLALVLSTFLFKPHTTKNKTLLGVAFGVLFGLLAIYGTLMGTPLEDGTIINVRELAVMAAGFAGGPLAGLIAGLMGGIHRYTVGGATALPCAISTILIGVIAGFVSAKLSGRLYLVKALALGFVLESAAMGLILALVQPFSVAVSILSQIAVTMIAANTVGFVLWVYLFRKVSPEQT
ncbi:MAG: LytS/YhcK type 5TM receptor domain-containing protein [Candidatus Bathyarchaeia archaeon]|jgi:sigma-B regulation protein RsbU (phosphoserine phosphatase)